MRHLLIDALLYGYMAGVALELQVEVEEELRLFGYSSNCDCK